MALDLIFEERATLSSHLARLDAIDAENAKWEAKSRRTFWGIGIGFVMPFLAVPLIIFLPFLIPLAVLLFGGGFLLCFGSVGFSIYYSRKCYNMRRIVPLRELLRALQDDVAEDTELHVVFDGRGPVDLSKVVGEHAGKTCLPRSGVVEYRDPWLSLSTKTKDGNALAFECVTETKQKRKPRRKGRVKTKNVSVDRLKVKLRVSPRSYAGLRTQLDRLVGRSLEGCEILAIDHEGHDLRLRAAYQGDESTATVILRLLSLLWGHLQPYVSPRRLKKIRQGARVTGEGGRNSAFMDADALPVGRRALRTADPSSPDASSAAAAAVAAAVGPSCAATVSAASTMAASSPSPGAGTSKARATVGTVCGCAGCGCGGAVSLFVAFIGLGFYLMTQQILESPLHLRVQELVRDSAIVEREIGAVKSFGSFPTGGYSTHNESGEAEYSIFIEGRRASGRLHVKGVREDGKWILVSLELAPQGRPEKVLLIEEPLPVESP